MSSPSSSLRLAATGGGVAAAAGGGEVAAAEGGLCGAATKAILLASSGAGVKVSREQTTTLEIQLDSRNRTNFLDLTL